MSNDNTEVKYNDIHTTGLGYLNRARTVPSQSGTYESVSLTGLGGRVDAPKYTYFDCKSVKGKALDKYLLLKDDINDTDKKVMVRFKFSDAEPDSYQAKDNKTGELVTRHVIKGRLLDIMWASIDGQEVEFELDDEENAEGDQSQQAQSDGNDQAQQQAPRFCTDDDLDITMELDPNDEQLDLKQLELSTLGYKACNADATVWLNQLHTG